MSAPPFHSPSYPLQDIPSIVVVIIHCAIIAGDLIFNTDYDHPEG